MAKDGLLFDNVYGWTSLPPSKAFKGIVDIPDDQDISQVMRELRFKMRAAHRVYLTPDFMEKAIGAYQDIRQIARWSYIARLPHETLWIEWEDESENNKQGVFLTTEDLAHGVWALQQFLLLEESIIIPVPYAHVLATEGPSNLVNFPFHTVPGMVPKGGSHTIKGAEHIGLDTEVSHHDETISFDKVPEFEGRLSCYTSKLYLKACALRPDALRKDFLLGTSNQTRGVVRFIITVLGMMNACPITKYYFPAPKKKHLVNGKPSPYFDHHVIELKLPKTKAINVVVRALDKKVKQESSVKAQEISGHLRCLERPQKSNLRSYCRHTTGPLINGRGTCLKCGKKVGWINHYQRGNARLGYVYSDYVVRGS